MEDIKTWCDYTPRGDGWAIVADESLVVVLGEPAILPNNDDTD
jgi:hypothetical protein